MNSLLHHRLVYLRRWFFIYLGVTILVPLLSISVVALINFTPSFRVNLSFLAVVAITLLIRWIFSSDIIEKIIHALEDYRTSIPTGLESTLLVAYLFITVADYIDLIEINVDPRIWLLAGLVIFYLFIRGMFHKNKYKENSRPDC